MEIEWGLLGSLEDLEKWNEELGIATEGKNIYVEVQSLEF